MRLDYTVDVDTNLFGKTIFFRVKDVSTGFITAYLKLGTIYKEVPEDILKGLKLAANILSSEYINTNKARNYLEKFDTVSLVEVI